MVHAYWMDDGWKVTVNDFFVALQCLALGGEVIVVVTSRCQRAHALDAITLVVHIRGILS